MSLVAAVTLCFATTDLAPAGPDAFVGEHEGVRYLLVGAELESSVAMRDTITALNATTMAHGFACFDGEVFSFAEREASEGFAVSVKADAVFVVKSARELIFPSPSIVSVGSQ